MSIDVKVTKQLDNDYVQVDTSMSKRSMRQYKVPKDSADSFCKEYKDAATKLRKNGNMIDFVLMPACVLLSYFIMGKTKASSALKLISCTALAMAVDYTGNIMNSNKFIDHRQKIIEKYNAKDIDEEDVFDKALK